MPELCAKALPAITYFSGLSSVSPMHSLLDDDYLLSHVLSAAATTGFVGLCERLDARQVTKEACLSGT